MSLPLLIEVDNLNNLIPVLEEVYEKLGTINYNVQFHSEKINLFALALKINDEELFNFLKEHDFDFPRLNLDTSFLENDQKVIRWDGLPYGFLFMDGLFTNEFATDFFIEQMRDLKTRGIDFEFSLGGGGFKGYETAFYRMLNDEVPPIVFKEYLNLFSPKMDKEFLYSTIKDFVKFEKEEKLDILLQKYATNKDYEEILKGMANYAIQEKSGGCANILTKYCEMEFDLHNLDALLSGSLALKDYDKIEKVLKAAAENNISFKSSNNELCARCSDKKSLQIFKEYGIRPDIKKREDISTLLLTSNINPEILDFVVNDCDLRDKIVPHTDYLLNIWKRRSNHDHLKENILWLLDNGFPKELDYAKVYKSSSETAMLNHVFNLRSRGVDVQNSELIFDIMQSKDIAVFKGLINSKLIDASKPPILYKALLAKTKKDFVSYILKKGGDFFAEMPNGDPQYFGIMLKRDLDLFLLHNHKVVDYSTKAENGNTWFNNICRNFTQFNLRINKADNIELYPITNGKKKLDLTVKDELGKTPLHNMIYSVAMENVSSAGSLPSSFTELLNNKNGHIKNVNLQDASGNTIGHYLAAFATKLSDSSRWFTTLFNEHGLDLTIKNAKGISVASLAKINIGNGLSDEMSATLDKILLEMAVPESENKKTKKFKI